MKETWKKRPWLVVLIIVVMLGMSSEYASMARQTSLKEALLGFVVLTLLVMGIIYWIRRSKRAR